MRHRKDFFLSFQFFSVYKFLALNSEDKEDDEMGMRKEVRGRRKKRVKGKIFKEKNT